MILVSKFASKVDGLLLPEESIEKFSNSWNCVLRELNLLQDSQSDVLHLCLQYW